jgi:hypothetical protein
VQWDVSPWWKYLDASMLDAVTFPNITVGAKWRDGTGGFVVVELLCL